MWLYVVEDEGMCQSSQKHFSSSFRGCISCQFISCLQPKNMILKPTNQIHGFPGGLPDPEIEFQAVASDDFSNRPAPLRDMYCSISIYKIGQRSSLHSFRNLPPSAPMPCQGLGAEPTDWEELEGKMWSHGCSSLHHLSAWCLGARKRPTTEIE